MNNVCTLCAVLQQFDGVAALFAQQVFQVLAAPTKQLFGTFLNLWIVYHGLSLAIAPATARQFIERIIPKGIAFIAISAVLQNQALLWNFFFDPVQNLSIAAGMKIIETGSTMSFLGGGTELLQPASGIRGGGQVTSQYAKLFSMAEKQFYEIIKTAYEYMTKLSVFQPKEFVAAAVTGFVLWFLFGLVLLVFGFFMIEAQFYFLAVGASAPLLIVAWAFEPTKKYAQAGVSMIVLAGLSIVTAALAMGFTVGTIHYFAEDFRCALKVGTDCPPGSDQPDRLFATISVMLLVGFISLLLHIKSKTIASNIAGSMDSAAPATLVAMGAKMASLGTVGAAAQLLGARKIKQGSEAFLNQGGVGGLAAKGLAKGGEAGASRLKEWFRRRE